MPTLRAELGEKGGRIADQTGTRTMSRNRVGNVHFNSNRFNAGPPKIGNGGIDRFVKRCGFPVKSDIHGPVRPADAAIGTKTVD